MLGLKLNHVNKRGHRSARFREVLAKHLHLPSDNNNIRHVKACVVLLFLPYVLISVLGYRHPMNSLHDDRTREHIMLTMFHTPTSSVEIPFGLIQMVTLVTDVSVSMPMAKTWIIRNWIALDMTLVIPQTIPNTWWRHQMETFSALLASQ